MEVIQNPVMMTSPLFMPETAQGTHAFKIDGYSLQKGLGVGNFIRSDPFTVGGLNWCIRCYPDGIVNEDSEGFIAVFLELLSVNSKVRALYKFTLVDELTGSASRWSNSQTALFSTVDMSKRHHFWGIPCFKRKSEIEQTLFLRNGSILITCDVTVISPPAQPVNAGMSFVKIPPSNLSADFGKLLESEIGADVTFSVQGEDFRAHNSILAARSPVFKAQLSWPEGKGKMEHITIEDLPPPVFKALLHFVYTDTLPSMEDLCFHDRKEMINCLLAAADRYAMGRLKLICEDILGQCLEVETYSTLSLI